jgi:hypothetical protein
MDLGTMARGKVGLASCESSDTTLEEHVQSLVLVWLSSIALRSLYEVLFVP